MLCVFFVFVCFFCVHVCSDDEWVDRVSDDLAFVVTEESPDDPSCAHGVFDHGLNGGDEVSQCDLSEFESGQFIVPLLARSARIVPWCGCDQCLVESIG